MNISIVYNVVVVFVLYLLNGEDLNLGGPVLVRAGCCGSCKSKSKNDDDQPYTATNNSSSGGGGTPAGGTGHTGPTSGGQGGGTGTGRRGSSDLNETSQPSGGGTQGTGGGGGTPGSQPSSPTSGGGPKSGGGGTTPPSSGTPPANPEAGQGGKQGGTDGSQSRSNLLSSVKTNASSGGGVKESNTNGLEVFVEGSEKANDSAKCDKKESGSRVDYDMKDNAKCVKVVVNGAEIWKHGDHNCQKDPTSVRIANERRVTIYFDPGYIDYDKDGDKTWNNGSPSMDLLDKKSSSQGGGTQGGGTGTGTGGGGGTGTGAGSDPTSGGGGGSPPSGGQGGGTGTDPTSGGGGTTGTKKAATS